MMRLETFFKNHFDTKEISDDNMRKFTEIHLQRLSASNGSGDFTQMITDTTTAYTNYFGSMTDEDTKFAVQQGLTIAVNNAIESFKKMASQKEGLVRATFGKDSPQYQDFFPNGVTEYGKATLQNIEMLMQRFVNASNKNSAQIGAALETEFQGYENTYKTARTAQLLKVGEVADSKTSTSTKRDNVENELMKNVHLIAAKFVGDVNKCMDFFDQSFIKNGTGGEEELPPEPTPTP